LKNQTIPRLLLPFSFRFILYFRKFPDSLKVNDTNAHLSDVWKLSLSVRKTVFSFALALLGLFIFIFLIFDIPSRAAILCAGALGIFSLVLNCFQFLPQIHETYQSGRVGALSTSAMAMQAPGSLLFSYTLARSPGTNATTWMAYAVGGLLQATLLALCLHLKRKQRGDYFIVTSNDNSNNICLESEVQ